MIKSYTNISPKAEIPVNGRDKYNVKKKANPMTIIHRGLFIFASMVPERRF
jgi:hypothetical protein